MGTFDWDLPRAELHTSLAKFYHASLITLGASTRANPDKHSILELPGELRNQIYNHFIKSSSPLQVRYHGIDCWNKALYLRLNGEVRVPINIVLSCRTLYHEAASDFYGNNTYTLKPDDAREKYHSYRETFHSYMEIASIFITRLGSQATWLSKLELNVSSLKGYQYHRCREGHGFAFPFFSRGDLFEVMPLLRAI